MDLTVTSPSWIMMKARQARLAAVAFASVAGARTTAASCPQLKALGFGAHRLDVLQALQEVFQSSSTRVVLARTSAWLLTSSQSKSLLLRHSAVTMKMTTTLLHRDLLVAQLSDPSSLPRKTWPTMKATSATSILTSRLVQMAPPSCLPPPVSLRRAAAQIRPAATTARNSSISSQHPRRSRLRFPTKSTSTD